jgi:hypothetical protein
MVWHEDQSEDATKIRTRIMTQIGARLIENQGVSGDYPGVKSARVPGRELRPLVM